MKTNKKQEDGTFKGEKWKQDCRYNGEWKDNKKHGFGIQIFGNGDKYEGGWMQNMRYGKGNFIISHISHKLLNYFLF